MVKVGILDCVRSWGRDESVLVSEGLEAASSSIRKVVLLELLV